MIGNAEAIGPDSQSMAHSSISNKAMNDPDDCLKITNTITEKH